MVIIGRMGKTEKNNDIIVMFEIFHITSYLIDLLVGMVIYIRRGVNFMGYQKKLFILFVLVLTLSGICLSNSFVSAKTVSNENEHISTQLLSSFTSEGGTVLSIEKFNPTKSDTLWSTPSSKGTKMQFVELDSQMGYWSYTPSLEAKTSGSAQSANYVSMKPNRNYKVSALVKTNFDRENCEVNLGFSLFELNEDGKKQLSNITCSGLKAQTDGWELFEYYFTTGPAIEYGRFYMTGYCFNLVYEENTLPNDC